MEAQGAIGFPMDTQFWGFLNQYLQLCTAPTLLTKQSCGDGYDSGQNHHKESGILEAPKGSLVLTDQASVIGIAGEKEPEVRKRSIFTERWTPKTEE